MEQSRKDQLDDIYRKHAKSLYYYLTRLSGSTTAAEDLVQETFYKATVSLSFYEEEEIKSWLFKVARHAYLDKWRKQQRWKWVPFIESVHGYETMLSPYEQPDNYIVNRESLDEMNSLYAMLPESYRTILILREEEALSYEELASVLEINMNQVKVNLHRARKRLHELAQQTYAKERDERG